jgi:hypothetical protein
VGCHWYRTFHPLSGRHSANTCTGGGKFQSKKQIEERKKNNESLRTFFGAEQNENEVKISAALQKVADAHGVESPTAVALAYVMAKAPNVFPLVGGRKVEHLHQNIKALEIKLSSKDIEELESVIPFEPGFPNNFVGEDPRVTGQTSRLLGAAAPMAIVRAPRAIGHE